MIKTLIFFPNGNYAACDEDGKQVIGEQGSAFMRAIEDKWARRVVTKNTEVLLPHQDAKVTVGDLLLHGHFADKRKRKK